MKPKLFVGSSREQLDLARAAQEELEHDVEATVWNQGVFDLSRNTMASLIDALEESDFALFILSPDDITKIRNRENQTVRDNVIFELGLFTGRLGIERCFMIVPAGVDDLHLPSDLAGLTPAYYQPDRQDGNLVAALGPACNRIRRAIQRQGDFKPAPAPKNGDVKAPPVFTDDPNDCLALIMSWMGSRNRSANSKVIYYDAVDKELNLTPGSARKYIEKAAEKYNYQAKIKGNDTILFEKHYAG